MIHRRHRTARLVLAGPFLLIPGGPEPLPPLEDDQVHRGAGVVALRQLCGEQLGGIGGELGTFGLPVIEQGLRPHAVDDGLKLGPGRPVPPLARRLRSALHVLDECSNPLDAVALGGEATNRVSEQGHHLSPGMTLIHSTASPTVANSRSPSLGASTQNV